MPSPLVGEGYAGTGDKLIWLRGWRRAEIVGRRERPLIRQPSAATFSYKGRREELSRREEWQRRTVGGLEHHFHLLPDLQAVDIAIDDIGLQ